jgi:hypothetical protein
MIRGAVLQTGAAADVPLVRGSRPATATAANRRDHVRLERKGRNVTSPTPLSPHFGVSHGGVRATT